MLWRVLPPLCTAVYCQEGGSSCQCWGLRPPTLRPLTLPSSPAAPPNPLLVFVLQVFMPSSISHVDYDQITEGGRGEAAPPAAAAAPGGGSRSGSFTDEEVDGEEEEEYGMSFAEADAAFARAAKGEPVLHEGGVTLGGAPGDSPVDQRTGLGVAGVLRRLQVWAREHGEKGYILLEAKELTRWRKAMQRWAEEGWEGGHAWWGC